MSQYWVQLRSRPSWADPKIVDRALDGDRNIYFVPSFLDTAPPEKFTENRTNFQTFHFQNNFGFLYLWKEKKWKFYSSHQVLVWAEWYWLILQKIWRLKNESFKKWQVKNLKTSTRAKVYYDKIDDGYYNIEFFDVWKLVNVSKK